MVSECAAPAAGRVFAEASSIAGSCPTGVGSDNGQLRGPCGVAGAAENPPAAAGCSFEGTLVGWDCVAAVADTMEAVGHRYPPALVATAKAASNAS